MTETQKPEQPGTRWARTHGCTCTLKGWEWNTTGCILHDQRDPFANWPAHLCRRHDLPIDATGQCDECYQQAEEHADFLRTHRSGPSW